MRLLLVGGLIASIGLSALPAQAQVNDAQVGALVEALRKAAPQTGKENDGLYSDWQILPGNIPRWSKQCVGRSMTPSEFEASPTTARQVVGCVMRNVLRDQYNATGNNESVAVRRAAAWWMTGDPTRYNSTTTATYTQKVLGFYQDLRSQRATITPTSTQPKPFSQRPPQPPAPRVVATAPAQLVDAQVGALVEALRLAAPKTGTQNDGLYSEWQIEPDNIPRWSKQCIGRPLTPSEFAESPVTARGILVCVMRDVLRDEYRASGNKEAVAVQRAASWWMTGDPSRYQQTQTASYTQKVLNFYDQLRSNRSALPGLLPHR